MVFRFKSCHPHYINKTPTKANKLALGVREYLYDFAEEQNSYTWNDSTDTAN